MGEYFRSGPNITDMNGPASMQGLTAGEAKEKLARHGYNEVPEKRESLLLLFLKKFWGVTPWMLEVTIVLTLILGRYFDTVIVAFLLLFNAVLGFVQESRATAALEFLREQLNVTARVKRDGSWTVIPARELVPGDVIRLRAGDFVPADVRISEGLVEVDQSSLTGESFIVGKSPGDTLYSGTVTRRGEATGQITATGPGTYFGKTIRLVQIARPVLRMERVTSSVVRWLLLLIVALLLIGLAVTWLRGGDAIGLLPLAVILLISAIPVALPTIFIISTALGSLELAKKGALVTRLNAIESAAGMDVLCADKTGTITMNRLAVAAVLPAKAFSERDLFLYGALSSREENQDPIDLALLRAAEERDIGLSGYRPERFTPFDPSRRRTEALVSGYGRQWRIYKGALNTILPLCMDGERDLAEAERTAGKRLGEGYKSIAVAVGDPDQAVKLAGVIYLEDPPRPDSKELVRNLAELGIKVKMLTGDADPIARRISAEVGLGTKVADFANIKKETDSGRALKAIEEADGFAEIYPEDKFLIVESLQKGGHIVGMTGDGVNDTPPLKQADVGIAVSGSADVARKAASVVLTVEGLDPIVDLVLIGRRTYRRISTWIFNKIVKTFQVIIFLILAFMLTGHTLISIFCIVLYYFLSDFVTLAIATDNAPYSRKPEDWNITGTVKASIPLGILLVIESFLLVFGGTYLFGLRDTQVYTLTFDVLMFFSLLDVLIVREKGHFWESKPGGLLLLAIVGDILVVALVSIFGLPGLAPIGAIGVLAILVCAIIATFTVNDLVKVLLVRWLWKESKKEE